MRRSVRLACQEQLLPGETLTEKWDHAQEYGFDALELRGAGDGAFAARLPELRRAAAAGVPMPTVCVAMPHFLGAFDAALRADAVAQLRQQLSVIAEIGGRLAATPASYGMFSRRLPPFHPPRSPSDDRAVLLDSLGELAAHAESAGVVLALEPLNRYEDHMVNTLDEAVDLCATLGSTAVGVLADTYHMNIEESDPCASLVAAGPWIRSVQVSDSNRLEPGAGHLPWDALLATVAASGYDDELTYECRLSGPAGVVLPQSTAFLRRMA